MGDMGEPFSSSGESPRSSGRVYAWLGLAAALVGPLAYVGQFLMHDLTTPWYLLALGTASVVLMGLSLVYARTFWRIAGLVLVGLLAAGEWYFLVWLSVLPPYAGPVAEGKPFPAFAAKLADGSPFTQADLKGRPRTVMTFFRGRW
jgi:hypothetical protein